MIGLLLVFEFRMFVEVAHDIADVWEMKKQLAGVIRLNVSQKVWNDNDAVQKLF